MKNQVMNYKKYYKTVENMTGPILLKDVPKERYDVRGMIEYAKSKGVTTRDLTREERSAFLISI